MTPQNHFDVLIIGAGPAGATAAYMLAVSGFKVAIIEKRRFPRFKLCGGLLTQKTIELLKEIFNTGLQDLISAGVIQYQSDSYRIGDANGNILQRRLDFPFHFVDREVYDAYWLDKAIQAGTTVFFEESAETVDIGAGKVITQANNSFTGHCIIAADGVFSRVRSILYQQGLLTCRYRQDIAAALEIYIPRDKFDGLPNFPAIYYGYSSWGYAWSFPGPKNQILGICSLKSKAKQSLYKDFKNFLQAHEVQPKKLAKPKGFAVPYGNYLNQAGYNNILLIGDAGGFADPLLGEGIYYAHKTAQLAVDAVIQARGHFRMAETIYSQMLNKNITQELRYAKKIRHLLFSIPKKWHSKVLFEILKRLWPKLEEAVQGQRSFNLLLPKRRNKKI